jgi:Mn-dependent DtxR family transcriptional regulator
MKNKLNPIESRILTVLIKDGGWMTTAQISKEAKVSWNTALAYLNRFEKKGWVNKSGDTTLYWKAIIEL